MLVLNATQFWGSMQRSSPVSNIGLVSVHVASSGCCTPGCGAGGAGVIADVSRGCLIRRSCWRWTGATGSARWCRCCWPRCRPNPSPRTTSPSASPPSCSPARWAAPTSAASALLVISRTASLGEYSTREAPRPAQRCCACGRTWSWTCRMLRTTSRCFLGAPSWTRRCRRRS